jgi:hypothetical protein
MASHIPLPGSPSCSQTKAVRGWSITRKLAFAVTSTRSRGPAPMEQAPRLGFYADVIIHGSAIRTETRALSVRRRFLRSTRAMNCGPLSI